MVHNLRVGYKIVEAGAGGEIKGDTVLASKTIRQSDNLQVDDSDVINELLDDAASQLADSLVQSADLAADDRGEGQNGRLQHRLFDDRSAPAAGSDFRRSTFRVTAN